MTYFIIGACILAGFIFCFLIGMQYGLHKYSTKMIEECYGGDIVIDISSVESDTITASFEKNPKEFMGFNYVIMGIKIKQ